MKQERARELLKSMRESRQFYPHDMSEEERLEIVGHWDNYSDDEFKTCWVFYDALRDLACEEEINLCDKKERIKNGNNL